MTGVQTCALPILKDFHSHYYSMHSLLISYSGCGNSSIIIYDEVFEYSQNILEVTGWSHPVKIGSKQNEPKRGRFFKSKYIESDRENSERDVSKSHTHVICVEISYDFNAAKSKSPMQTIPKLVKWSIFATKQLVL